MLALLGVLALGMGFFGTTGCTKGPSSKTYTATVTGIDANQQTHSQTVIITAAN
jgi:hypothetical protein